MNAQDFYGWLSHASQTEIKLPKINNKLNQADIKAQAEFFNGLKQHASSWIDINKVGSHKETITKALALTSIFNTSYENKAARNFIVKLIEKGNQKGIWNLPVPPLTILNFRQPNPFVPSALSNYAQFRPLFEYLVNDVSKNNHHHLEPMQQMGMTFISCAYLGGLNRESLLSSLITQVSNYQYDENYAWVDFIDQENVIFRWHPDPVSELLITRYLLEKEWIIDGQENKKIVLHAVNAYLSLADRHIHLNTLSQLLEACQTHFQLCMPQVVRHYLSNPYRSTPLPPVAWQRYRNVKSLSVSDEAYESNDAKTVNKIYEMADQPAKAVDVMIHDQNKLITMFRKTVFARSSTLNKKDTPKIFIEKCHDFLNKNTSKLTQPLFYFFHWLAFRVSTGIRISSAKTYASHLKPIVLSLMNVEFKTVNEAALLECYNITLNQLRLKSTVNQMAIVGNLIKNFHIFLVLYAQAPRIPFEDIDYSSNGKKLITKANTLNEQEINSIQQELNSNPRLRFVFLLGVRLGMRFEEVAMLRFGSFIGCEEGFEAFCFITDSAFHDNKRDSSKRKLSLKKYLNTTEYQDFIEFYNKRKYEEFSTGNQLKNLFLFSEDKIIPLDRREKDKGILPILWRVTGDRSLTYHSLRHAFVNKNLFSLLIDEKKLTRDSLMAFSYEIGHLSPEETLKTYFHLMPLVAYHYLNRNLTTLLNLPATNVCQFFSYEETKIKLKSYKKSKRKNLSFWNVLAGYYREDHLQRYQEKNTAIKKQNQIKSALSNIHVLEWMPPEIFYRTIVGNLKPDLIERLALINQHPVEFYLHAKKYHSELTKVRDQGARGLSWPKDDEEKYLLYKTYRAIEGLSNKEKNLFINLFKTNRDKKNLIFETKDIIEAVDYCHILNLIMQRLNIKSETSILVRLIPDNRSNTPEIIQAKTWLKHFINKKSGVKEIRIVGQSLNESITDISGAKTHAQGKVSISIQHSQNKASHGFKMGVVLALLFLNCEESFKKLKN
jgi:hypothetical protein